MTEIAVETTSYLTEDRSWLLWDQKMARFQLKLNFALFTAGTHFPNGFLPSGLCVGIVTSGGLGGPYGDGLSDGRQTLVGHLYDSIRVPADLNRRVSVALVDSFAVIHQSKLPANHGLDANGRADLPLIKYRA